jgi:hypothetical protein
LLIRRKASRLPAAAVGATEQRVAPATVTSIDERIKHEAEKLVHQRECAPFAVDRGLAGKRAHRAAQLSRR